MGWIKTIISGIMFVAIFMIILGMINKNTNIMAEQNNQTQIKISNIELQLKSLLEEEMNTRYMIAQAWWNMQGDEILNKFDEFMMGSSLAGCMNEPINIQVMRNFYDYNASFFNVLVYTYNTGYQVFYRNGEIKCYPSVIQKMNPENISCDDLCVN